VFFFSPRVLVSPVTFLCWVLPLKRVPQNLLSCGHSHTTFKVSFPLHFPDLNASLRPFLRIPTPRLNLSPRDLRGVLTRFISWFDPFLPAPAPVICFDPLPPPRPPPTYRDPPPTKPSSLCPPPRCCIFLTCPFTRWACYNTRKTFRLFFLFGERPDPRPCGALPTSTLVHGPFPPRLTPPASTLAFSPL